MSIQSARDFLSKVASDGEFRKGLTGCKTKTDQLRYAQRAGYDFTGEEVGAARTELQDRDLDSVSGGALDCCFGCENDAGCTTYSAD